MRLGDIMTTDTLSLSPRPTRSAFVQLSPSRQQFFDDDGRFLSKPGLEPAERRKRVLPDRGQLPCAKLNARIESDVCEVVDRSEIADVKLTIGRLPTRHPPVEPVLCAVSDRRN